MLDREFVYKKKKMPENKSSDFFLVTTVKSDPVSQNRGFSFVPTAAAGVRQLSVHRESCPST